MSIQESDHLELQCRPEEQTVDLELAEFRSKLSTNFDVLPLFERENYNFICTRNYSLANNEKLRSRWHERVMGKRPPGTAAMPNINDYHFHNCRTKFLPSESRSNYPPPGFHLGPGPGVDNYGQRPIPNELLNKRNPDKATADKKKTKKQKKLRSRSLNRGDRQQHQP